MAIVLLYFFRIVSAYLQAIRARGGVGCVLRVKVSCDSAFCQVKGDGCTAWGCPMGRTLTKPMRTGAVRNERSLVEEGRKYAL